MGKSYNRLRRFSGRHAPVLAILGLVLAALAFMPDFREGAKETASESKDAFAGLLGGLGILDNATADSSWRVYVKYEQGVLTETGKSEVPGSGATFSVSGTATTGNPAKFVMKCGVKDCGQATDRFAEPITFWQVTVPDVAGLTALEVTAGAATLRVTLS